MDQALNKYSRVHTRMLIISEDSEYRESGFSVINVTCSGYQYFSMLAKLACSSSKINE